MNSTGQSINDLKELISRSLQHELRTTNDFAYLSGSIQERTHEFVSINTLKRIWGHGGIGVQPRNSTLDIMAHYVGYRNWNDFMENYRSEGIEASHCVIANHIHCATLPVSSRICLTWNPGRRCIAEYLGNEIFRVIEVENSKLKVGNTFHTALIVEGQPLMIDNLICDNHVDPLYLIGTKGGITSLEIL